MAHPVVLSATSILKHITSLSRQDGVALGTPSSSNAYSLRLLQAVEQPIRGDVLDDGADKVRRCPNWSLLREDTHTIHACEKHHLL